VLEEIYDTAAASEKISQMQEELTKTTSQAFWPRQGSKENLRTWNSEMRHCNLFILNHISALEETRTDLIL
jgi:uncharacterized protein YukE